MSALPPSKTHTELWETKLERNVRMDREKINPLDSEWWRVTVFWEHEIKADVEECAMRVSFLYQYPLA